MDCAVGENKETFWRGEQELYRKEGGSVAAFCRSRGHTENKFRYWLEKFDDAKPVKAKSDFIAIKVESSKRIERTPPDPAWLAELILHLSAGVRR